MFSLEESQETESAEQELSTSGAPETVESSKTTKGRIAAVKPKGKSKGKPKGKAKKTEPTEPEVVFHLISADNKCETYGEHNWQEAAAKVLHDKKGYRIFKAVELLLEISYKETAQL